VCFLELFLKKKDGFRNDPNLGDINVIYEDTRAWLYIYIYIYEYKKAIL